MAFSGSRFLIAVFLIAIGGGVYLLFEFIVVSRVGMGLPGTVGWGVVWGGCVGLGGGGVNEKKNGGVKS